MTAPRIAGLDVQRTRYFENQYLTTADFQLAQDYHRRTLGRHEIGAHTWGIMVGLDLVETPDPVDPTLVDVHLTPGVATDGYGRQLVSFSRILVDPALFDAFVDDAHRSLWIEYYETTARPSEDGWADCADGGQTRTIETFRLLVDPVDTTADVIVEGVIAAPPDTPADTSVPYQEIPPEPPVGRWLVRLGTVRWDGGPRRLRPAAPGRLAEGRRYIGSIASEVLAPDDTLRVARRTPTSVDDADFARFEGRLRVQGRINAERELWLEGDALRFTYDAGADEGVPMTLARDRDGAGHRLHLQLGTAAAATTTFAISAGTPSTTALEVRTDGRVRMPSGPLAIGPAADQEIELSSPAYGMGTQRPAAGATGTLYLRSPQRFAWYTGGGHDAQELEPGAGGTRRLMLDEEGSLDFGSTTHQMLKLWSGGGGGAYGIGVQPYTLYFRTHFDMAWFRGGSHIDQRGNAGGGAMMMHLDEFRLSVNGAVTTRDNLTVGAGGDAAVVTRHVIGKQVGSDAADSLFLNWGTGRSVVVGAGGAPSVLEVNGPLRVRGVGPGSVESVVKVVTRETEVVNASSGAVGRPGLWSVFWVGEFDEIQDAFVVLNGFSLADHVYNPTPGHWPHAGAIPQHVWARLIGFDTNKAWGDAFCAESDGKLEKDNRTVITVVAIGRKFT
ncbi:hypothetical protein [Nocardia jinanensis]|uniref:Uncharacterized protein n=1 Tax=Nocardia jinanensis TaxID=382504 RepID=A0A917RM76_9NOCA|nr:hypothetical protein [Nocardia jinanensis]GGL14611.1 hypothetical protein GCM10011588_31420 [Nocardia jinanensis]